MPKDIHVEPQRFAAELISRLETVLREREAQERLEERLKRVRLVSRLRVAVGHQSGQNMTEPVSLAPIFSYRVKRRSHNISHLLPIGRRGGRC